jgi:hypothetical protein
LIGNMTIGYQEGFKAQALFENELHIAAVPSDNNRIIVVDTWNCVIREVILGPNGPTDFRTRSFLLFGTVYNKRSFCVDFIHPRGLYPLHGDLVAFINNRNTICQIHTKRRLYQCMFNYEFSPTNFIHMYSINAGTLVLEYNTRTIELTPTQTKCPDDYTSYEGSSCSIYAPWNRGNFGGWYIDSNGLANRCVEPTCPLGFIPGRCARDAPATCVPCIVDNPNNYAIRFRTTGSCFFDLVHPCPVNMFAKDDDICEPCPNMMYTLGSGKIHIYDCVCPDKMQRVSAKKCIMASPLFPMYKPNKCPFTHYEVQYFNRTTCVNCRKKGCTVIRIGQYLEWCHGEPKQCLIPFGSRATTQGARYDDPLSCKWECLPDFYLANGKCVFQGCLKPREDLVVPQ